MNRIFDTKNFFSCIGGRNLIEFLNFLRHLCHNDVFRHTPTTSTIVSSPTISISPQSMKGIEDEDVCRGGDKESMDKKKDNIKEEVSSLDGESIKKDSDENLAIEVDDGTIEGDKNFTFLTNGQNIGSLYNRKDHKPLPRQLALSFSGAGFLGIYHYGVIHCLQAYAPTLLSRVVRYAGTSAGSIIASLLALSPEIFNKSMRLMMKMVNESSELTFGPYTNGFSIHEKLVKTVDEVIPNDVSCLKDKLYISMTNAKTNQNILYNHFTTKEQLAAAICASCFIPGWSAHYNAPHPVIDGVSYIDGALSNNLPVFDDIETITISPFSGGADIAPIDNSLLASYLPMQVTFGKQVYSASFANIQRMGYALFPPKGEALKMYYDLGFKDAFLYLFESGRLERPKAQTFLNVILRRHNNRISELPFHIKDVGLDKENNTPIMDDISSSTIISSTQYPQNNYNSKGFEETGGLLNSTTVYDYQRSQMLQNHKRIEEAMRLKMEKEEAERIKAETLAAKEQDLFKDMVPEIKGRKLLINSGSIKKETEQTPHKDLFSVDDKNFIIPEGSAVLGELDEQIDNNVGNLNEWDTEIDLDSLNKTEKEQKRKEREMRHKERYLEHQKRMKEKRGEVI